MKNKKKKKGSSFIVVVVVTAVIFTGATTMISVVANDYKMRINESRRVQNLYESDSGLDIVYNIIVKNSEAATIAANEAVKESLKNTGEAMTLDLQPISEKSYGYLNGVFKTAFYSFLKGQNSKIQWPNGVIEPVIKTGITNRKYLIKNDNNTNGTADDTYEWKAVEIKNGQKLPTIDIVYEENSNNIVVNVISTFENDSTKGNLKNTKSVETKYTIVAPEYQQTILNSSNNKEIKIYPIFDNKVITADGNLDINGEATIKGDIWVKGNGELGDNPAYAFDKYRGGISLQDAILNLTGNIMVSKTLHLKNNADANITGNIYALNTYIGKSNKVDDVATSTNNELNLLDGSLIVNNDLALNTANSTVRIDNFYGINDRTTSTINSLEKAMKSSSIIVNDINNTSTVEIDKAYIMGVAYIDTEGEKYQTGESVAVKGNYLAYTDIMPGYEDRVTLNYYNPLQLIETIDGRSNLQAKADYFNTYYTQAKDKLNTGGIILNEAHAIGAYIGVDGETKHSGVNSEDVSVVTNIKKDFAKSVYAMGDMNGTSFTDTLELYNNNNVNVNNYSKTVANQIDFTALDLTKVESDVYGNLILINDGSDISIINNKIVSTVSKFNGKDVTNSVIITNGNVRLQGSVTLTGNIITTKNVIFEGSEKKILTYNADVTRKIIASNYAAVENALALGSSNGQVDSVNIGNSILIQETSNGYDVNTFIKKGIWKLKK